MDHRGPLLRLAVPNYVALLSGVLTGIVDVAWVARLGPSPVAAVAVATGVENVLLGAVLLINGGVTVRLAAALGAGDRATAGAVIRAGWRLYLLLTPVVVLAGLVLRRALAGAFLDDPGTARLAEGYFTVLFPGVAIFYAQQVVDAIFAGRGDTRTPMRLALTANALILILDPVLIYGTGPLPALGVAGAAAATALGRAAALAIGVLLLRRGARPPVVAASPDGGVPAATGGDAAAGARDDRAGRDLPPGAAVGAVLRTGAPIAGDFLVRMGGALVLLSLVGRFGVSAVAAYGIGMKVLYFATMAFYAIRNAATIHTPRTLSAHPGQRRAVGRQVCVLALLTGVLASALFAVLAPLVMRAFTADRAVAAAGVLFLRSVGGYLVPIAGVIAVAGFLMATGRGPRLFAVTVAGTVAQTALAWWLPSRLGLPGVWLAMASAAVLQLALVVRLAGLTAGAVPGRDPEFRHPFKPSPVPHKIRRVDNSCLFCRIVAGEIPATVVHRTETTVAFRDIDPKAPTHVLVIPVDHHADVTALAADPSAAADVLAAAAAVAEAEGLAADGFRVIFNTGRNAGQEVFHVHAHVVGGAPLGPMLAGK